MGVNIGSMLPKEEIDFSSLKGKVVAIDAMNAIYQFVASIRQRDGTLLMDSNGNVTSHLQGLFTRSVNLMSKGLRLVYVFDGEAPKLKVLEREKRMKRKKVAEEKYLEAVSSEDVDGMYKYSRQNLKVSDDMISECKELCIALGLCVIEAPSEAEGQAAYMCSQGDVYCVASQDADALLFGTPLLVRNLTLASKRRVSGRVVNISPEMIKLEEVLLKYEFDLKRFIVYSILVGTDFNPGGVSGIGPKKALKLVSTSDYDKMFDDLSVDFDWHAIYDIFVNLPVVKDYKLEFKPVDRDKVKELLVDKHEFSEERVDSVLAKLDNVKDKGQKGLFDF